MRTGPAVILLQMLHRLSIAAAAVLALGACTASAEPPSLLAAQYRMGAEETLPEVGRRHGLGYNEVLGANPGINPWVPGEGTPVLLPIVHLPPDAPREGIVVNLADMRLYWWPADGPPRSFPVGIGREELETPAGMKRISRKVEEPVWYPTRRMRREDPTLPPAVGPGPDNPLGSHALYLEGTLFRIHGTNRPWGVGSRASSGCIRLYPEDIPTLFASVPVGTPVRVVDQQVKAGWIGDALYLEVHPDPTQSDAIEYRRPWARVLPPDLTAVVTRAAGDRPVVIDWERVRKAGLERRGVPVRVGLPAPTGERRDGQPVDARTAYLR